MKVIETIIQFYAPTPTSEKRLNRFIPKSSLSVLLIVICSLLLVACGQDRTKDSLTLQYVAAPNGEIEGPVEQKLLPGETGETVKAVPDEGYHFTSWSDGSTEAERKETDVDRDLKLTASFALNNYHLTYVPTENGYIKGQQVQTVEHGSDGAEVTAVAAEGYRFLKWSDGEQSASRVDRELQSSRIIKAHFIEANLRLEYIPGANGTIEGETSQVVELGKDGTAVKAVPAESYHFAGWSDGVKSAERIDLNPRKHLRVTANFAKEVFQVTYSADSSGTIEGEAEQLVANGAQGQEVIAVPAPGYDFSSWSDGVKTANRQDSDVTAPLDVVAKFVRKKYLVVYQADEHGRIKGKAEQKVAHGDDAAPVEAVANPNYRFVRWSDGVSAAQRTDKQVTGPLSLRAEFEPESYQVGGTVSGLVNGTELQLSNNGEDVLTITENGQFKFAEEVQKNSRYTVEVAVQPSAPTQTCLVSNGSGTVKERQITDIKVVCTLNGYAIGGAVAGLQAGDQVVLVNNDKDTLTVKKNGPFSFSEALEDGSDYQVKIVSLPKRENWTCKLKNGTGTLAGTSVADLRVECYQQVVLETRPGRKKVELFWNHSDFKNVTFNLCAAQEALSEGSYSRCADLYGGITQTDIKNGYQAEELINDKTYWFQVEASYPDGRKTLSSAVKAVPFSGLNDTGIDWCSDLAKNHQTDASRPEKERACKALATGFPGQDGLVGRDAAARVRKLPKKGSGTGGFDFLKYCRSGEAAGEKKCPPNPQPGSGYDEWACTLDNVTGLFWEVKTDSGLRDGEKTYFWHQSNEQVNGGDPGVEKGGGCEEEACSTEDYVEVINEIGLCGYNDWRLPTRRELLSIVDNGRFEPAIDSRYFPNSEVAYYWTSSPYPDQLGLAWQVYFHYGESKPGEKSTPQPVRLVRGKTITFGQENP